MTDWTEPTPKAAAPRGMAFLKAITIDLVVLIGLFVGLLAFAKLVN